MDERMGTVFDIQRYSIHDGPGIRTVVFLKGCPLHCQWCANPESQSEQPVLFYIRKKCISCASCAAVCPEKAIEPAPKGEGMTVRRTLCTSCFECVQICPTGAMLRKGQVMTVEEVLREATRDRVFFARSGGGVTLSGGEPLRQYGFARAILEGLREQEIHTAVETTGMGRWEELLGLAELADLVLFDFKHIDANAFHRYVGTADVETLYGNMARLARERENVMVRIPLIPGVNSDPESVERMIGFLTDNHIHKVELLRFHQLGASKYDSLGIPYRFREVPVMTEEEFAAVRERYCRAGLLANAAPADGGRRARESECV